MSISPLALKAKQVIEAQWLHGPAFDLATQAAEVLESAQMLMSPELAAELERLRSQVAGMANPPRELFLALYDGAEPELFTTVEAARDCCDDLAKVDAHGKCWDWTVDEHGIHVQFWTHSDDDRPTGETSGTVTSIVVKGNEPLSELEQLRAEVAALKAERHSTNEKLSEAAEALREQRDRIADLEAELRIGAPWTCPVCSKENNRDVCVICETDRPESDVVAARSADRLTRLLAPTQALRGDETAEAGDA